MRPRPRRSPGGRAERARLAASAADLKARAERILALLEARYCAGAPSADELQASDPA